MRGRVILAAMTVLSCSGSAPAADPAASVTVELPAVAPAADLRDAAGITIAEAFPPPDGFERVPADAFGAWVQARKVLAADAPVHMYDGSLSGHDGRVVELDMVKGDLQQCADSLIRLRAEWRKENGLEVSYHATSGDPIPWSRVEGGEQPYAVGNGLKWKPASPASWDKYLGYVFMWAGTLSLEAYDTKPLDTPVPGAILIKGGSPGHTVMLVDVAKRGDEVLLLVGEGFMPAQEFHIERGPVEGWFAWDPTDGANITSWGQFGPETLKTWKD